jgi:hypothetical protein
MISKKQYLVRVYLSKGSYPVQLDKFHVLARNRTEARIKAEIKVKRKKTPTYPMSWYAIDIQ